jgi:hypothetical protein
MLICYCGNKKSYTCRTDKEFMVVVKSYSVNCDETQLRADVKFQIHELHDTGMHIFRILEGAILH